MCIMLVLLHIDSYYYQSLKIARILVLDKIIRHLLLETLQQA